MQGSQCVCVCVAGFNLPAPVAFQFEMLRKFNWDGKNVGRLGAMSTLLAR
jgi:hypothetical protein